MKPSDMFISSDSTYTIYKKHMPNLFPGKICYAITQLDDFHI